MKRLHIYLISLMVIVSLSIGCGTVNKVFGKSSQANSKAAAKIDTIEKQINTNNLDKLNEISVLASGIDYSLNKVSNKEPAVVVADDLDKRVISLAGKPNLDAEKEMWMTVDKLVSEIITERQEGQAMLDQKDKEIASIESTGQALLGTKDVQIDKYMKLASDTASKADSLTQTVDQMNAWGGLGAIWYGIKHLVVRFAWILGIGGVLFIILRFASLSNPIAASIFAIVERIGSWFINIIVALAPKALDKANAISKIAYNDVKGLLTKIVDNIQNIRQIEAKTGQPITLENLLNELDKSMDTDEKAMITKIKVDLGYNTSPTSTLLTSPVIASPTTTTTTTTAAHSIVVPLLITPSVVASTAATTTGSVVASLVNTV